MDNELDVPNNPFQQTFQPASSPLPQEESTQNPLLPPPTPEPSKNGRKNKGSAKSTRSAPITRPRKVSTKKASSKKRGRPTKPIQYHTDEQKAAASRAFAAQQAEQSAPKKQRARRTVSKANREIKIDLSHAMTAFAGIKSEDSVLLAQMVAELQKRGKPARKRIVAALGRIFQ